MDDEVREYKLSELEVKAIRIAVRALHTDLSMPNGVPQWMAVAPFVQTLKSLEEKMTWQKNSTESLSDSTKV